MQANRFSALPVVDKSRLIGILTTSDVLQAFIDLSGVAEVTTQNWGMDGSGKWISARWRFVLSGFTLKVVALPRLVALESSFM